MKLERPGERLPPLTNKSDRSSPVRAPYSPSIRTLSPDCGSLLHERKQIRARARILEILDFA